MIEINPDKSVDINRICGKHYRFAEPRVIKKIAEYRLGRNLNDVSSRSATGISVSQLNSFLHWIQTNLRKILKGNPDSLNKLQQDIENNYSFMIAALSLERKRGSGVSAVTDMLEDIFGYLRFSSVELPGYYQYECDQLLQIRSVVRSFKNVAGCDKANLLNNYRNILIKQIKQQISSSLDKFLDRQKTLLTQKIQSIPIRQPITGKISVQYFRNEMKTAIEETYNELYQRDEISLLNYNSYSNKHLTSWSAYHLVMELKLKVCPYCNRNYINPYYSGNSKTRADLDHFFPKSKYPYFSMSFYNLIPSCKVCNSSFKGGKDFSYNQLLNPYEGGFGEDVRFTFQIDSVSSFPNPEHIELQLLPQISISTAKLEKIKGNKKMFALESMYSFHRDIVAEMIVKRQVYSEAWIDDIFRLYKYNPKSGEGFFKFRHEVVEMVFSNYISPNKSDKRILAKLTQDIARELNF